MFRPWIQPWLSGMAISDGLTSSCPSSRCYLQGTAGSLILHEIYSLLMDGRVHSSK